MLSSINSRARSNRTSSSAKAIEGQCFAVEDINDGSITDCGFWLISAGNVTKAHGLLVNAVEKGYFVLRALESSGGASGCIFWAYIEGRALEGAKEELQRKYLTFHQIRKG
jgi:hypothetical protein